MRLDASAAALDAQAWPVMVLAHDEERHIEGCLESILDAGRNCNLEIFVMANGCTDRTEPIVREYARRHPEVHIVTIALADKCNAWNVFVHETVPTLCPGREIYFFMDGDARARSGSFKILARALRENPHAHAASALPVTGRSVVSDRRRILSESGLVANFYSLRGSFVDRIRESSVRLPLNLEGDDGLVGALAKWDLQPAGREFDDGRIVACEDAAFEFDSLSPLRLEDWRKYWGRLTRYGRRRYEFRLLGPLLKTRGLSAIPHDVTQLYGGADSLRLSWDGIYTLANLVALRRMRRLGKGRNV